MLFQQETTHGLEFPHVQQPLKAMEVLLLSKDCPTTRALPPDLAIMVQSGASWGRGAVRRVQREARSNEGHHLGDGGDREGNTVVRGGRRHFRGPD